MYHGLTLKQKKFADKYIISGNATQSAIKFVSLKMIWTS
ncbi:terminase small subunit [Peptostreptococcus russellii]